MDMCVANRDIPTKPGVKRGDETPTLSVIVPAYNEELNLGKVIEDTTNKLDKSPLAERYEIVIVDDGSTDLTSKIADEAEARYERVKVYRHSVNCGFGAALRTGFLNASGSYVSYIPGDGEIKVDQVLRLLGHADGAEIVVSSRHCPDEATRHAVRPWYREFLTWGFQRLLQASLGFDSRGMEGIFLVRRDLLCQVPLESDSGLLCMEVILHCKRMGCRFAHGTVELSPRLGGKSKVTNLRSIAMTLWETARLRWRAGTIAKR
jgi:glycosyltransferase involved in cell wall biosynthesis